MAQVNLKLVLAAGGGLIATSAGGYFILKGPGGTIDSKEPREIILPTGDNQDTPMVKLPDNGGPIPQESDTRKIMISIPGDDKNNYGEIYKKYRDHFSRKASEFVSGLGLSIPNKDSEANIYEAWEDRKDEIRGKYSEEFGVEVDNNHVHPDNIGSSIISDIFSICQGGDEVRRGKYCVVDGSGVGN